VSIQPAALEVLAAAAPVLTDWGRWFLFGAQAVIAYGVPRLSADVDVTLALEPARAHEFAEQMKRAGFSLRVEDPDFIVRTRVMPFVHDATAMPLDVVLAGSGLEEEFLNRARPLDIGGTRMPVIDLADLIVAKIVAGRTKDIDDATNLWRIHGRTVDSDRIRVLLRELEDALGEGDFVGTFEKMMQQRS
jgi:hypothetical protein